MLVLKFGPRPLLSLNPSLCSFCF